MKTGALLFAYNTNETDYFKIAEYSAKSIKRWLNIPVTVITDAECKSDSFDNIIIEKNKNSSKRYFDDRNSVVEWKNSGRSNAYDLTPYDKTLLLDVDYLVASSQLKKITQYDCDFLCYDSSMGVTQAINSISTFGKFHMKMFWATVIMFKKTKQSQIIFEIMKMVENNYRHYANLYGFSETPYRNDYALSIAISIASGHLETKNFSIPWPMINVNPEHFVEKKNDDSFKIFYKKINGKRERFFYNEVNNQDIHVMGKSALEKIVETG